MSESEHPEPIETGFEIKSGYETKAGGTGDDVAMAFDEFMRTFETFKENNDERLRQIENRVSADVVTEEKLERINRALDAQKSAMDQLTLKASRPQIGGVASFASPAALQHKAAFHAYMRKGQTGNLHRLEEKALSVDLAGGDGSDGGYLVPPETEAAVIRGVKEISPIRAIAGNRTVSASIYKKPFSITGPATGWVGGDGDAAGDEFADPGRARFPDHGALRHAFGDPDAAGRLGGEYRRVAGGGDPAGVRRAGGDGVRPGRRQCEAAGLPGLYAGGERVLGLGQDRLYRDGE
jgi:hypothetical protein